MRNFDSRVRTWLERGVGAGRLFTIYDLRFTIWKRARLTARVVRRVTGRELGVKERDEEGWRRGYYVELPDDCMVVEAVRRESGEKVRHSEFGIDPERRQRVVFVEGVGKDSKLYLDYIADIVTLGGVLPDSAPYFCEGVICELAGELAISIVSNAELAAAYKAEARENLQRAIDMDARQWKSNDQHPLRGIMERNILWK